jgi:ABC-type phosphate/phosphonate transport system substrate-binding protein
MRHVRPFAVLAGVLGLIAAQTLLAASPWPAAEANVTQPHKTAFSPPGGGAPAPAAQIQTDIGTGDLDVLVLSAPPRETPEEGARLYGPIAEYLSRTTGRRIVYRHPQNWLSYQTEMLKGRYDLVFDGPHFNSWRASHMQHTPLVRLPQEHLFVVIVRRSESGLNDVKQLAGKKVCALNPPNLGTLALLAEFDNPLRQPVIVNQIGWKDVYQGVTMDKHCVAGVLPLANLRHYDGAGQFTRIVFKTRPLPNQAFSAGPRVPPALQAEIAAALVSEAGNAPTAALRAAYGAAEQGFVAARKEDYAGLDSYLKEVWAFAR